MGRAAVLALAICVLAFARQATKADCRYGDLSEPERKEIVRPDGVYLMCVDGRWIRDQDILAVVTVERARLWTRRVERPMKPILLGRSATTGPNARCRRRKAGPGGARFLQPKASLGQLSLRHRPEGFADHAFLETSRRERRAEHLLRRPQYAACDRRRARLRQPRHFSACRREHGRPAAGASAAAACSSAEVTGAAGA